VPITGIAPQFLVDDLDRSIGYYRDRLGFTLDFVYEGFYASVSRDGFAIHLKCAPKTVADRVHRREGEHLDAFVSVTGVRGLFDDLRSRGADVIRTIEERPWGSVDFYVGDPDGYILCFSEPRQP
jgi:catechol 2,3-dioxygenase-like lactoylglutathione lyase family enzyme